MATSAEADTVLRRLARDGWTARAGFALPDPSWDVGAARLILHGRIGDDDLETAQLAVLAAARGAGVVAICDAESAAGRALIDDLSRLGPLHRGIDGTDLIANLIPEQRALLDRLAAGDTIAAAAAAEFLSLRTANRRIAEARTLFGVRTTREAVLAYLRQRQRAPE
ncbi:LuxR family transcriptional regulator [Actinoplanes sp. NEAU-A12]|uniref:LuxR family transcriptional regulator n=1 Tax=Actinoplanes sandaracinus TaxID=3045177 RepID=A0ABT6WZB9_9ACTN|nr:LuxR family transcriptional regulator [Actinoplanes sandaracinus]MDI6105067.1 LuxR family transcriptional regulator [Actinoplanes sandaracinus]